MSDSFLKAGIWFINSAPSGPNGLNKEKLKYQGSLRVKVRERKRDYEVPLKLTSAARWITSKQLQRAAS